MSDPADRDLAEHSTAPGKARASLGQIRLMWGIITVEGDTVTRVGMYGQTEKWRRVPGLGPPAIYEKQGGS